MPYEPQPIADLTEAQRSRAFAELAAACGDDRITHAAESRQLTQLMAPGERLLWSASGWRSGQVLAALTDRRIIIIDNRWVAGVEHSMIDLENVNRISGDNGVFYGGVTIQDGTLEHKISVMEKAAVLPFVQRAREAVDARKEAAGGGAAAPTSAAEERLRQLERLADLHERGLLTAAEFASEKAKLLSQ